MLTQAQKKVVFEMAAAAVPVMDNAEFLRATILWHWIWDDATDPTVIAPVIITEINRFRLQQDQPNRTAPGFASCDPTPAITAATLNLVSF